ncbi:MAG: polysaccharide deacetylase family protein [Thermanaerothrix sp.]|nr:polysaccharide deacetylase family protein [Thermanaerothrix sp.]
MDHPITRRGFLKLIIFSLFYLEFTKLIPEEEDCYIYIPTEKGKKFLESHVICSGDESKPHVAITYDDQPYFTEVVEKVLQVYNEADAKMTLFLVMEKVAPSKDMQELLRKIIDDGHEVGFHGWNKEHLICSKFRDDVIQRDLEKCLELIYSIYPYYHVKFIRWPFGETGRLVKIAAQYGLQVVNWSLESGGLDEKTKDRVIGKATNGSIVLSHLTRYYDVSQVSAIISGLHERGFKLVTVSEVLRKEDTIPLTPEYFKVICSQ